MQDFFYQISNKLLITLKENTYKVVSITLVVDAQTLSMQMTQHIYQCNLNKKIYVSLELTTSTTMHIQKQSETQYIHEDEHKLYEIQEETKRLENKVWLTL